MPNNDLGESHIHMSDIAWQQMLSHMQTVVSNGKLQYCPVSMLPVYTHAEQFFSGRTAAMSSECTGITLCCISQARRLEATSDLQQQLSCLGMQLSHYEDVLQHL